ncbi:hypothetical protein [Spiroplasma endosymbiont of Aspidapion aeneum]|uniref:hypothetical protein n=1 Tax=Spiroplasma endosymbiont of Aspidapion aeneum TaxID=3066276 RepID=UPI00313ED4C7
MYNILGNTSIPLKSFNTIYETIFCALYNNIKFKNSFDSNRNEIKKQIVNVIEEISNDQMGGGIKFDVLNLLKNE